MSSSILVIEDSATHREFIVQNLKGCDIPNQVVEAGDGLEGLKLLLDSPVDLIICDLEMPKMDGFKFVSSVKNRPEHQNTPIIILTSSQDYDTKIKCLELGVNDYVSKPFNPRELVARVKTQLHIKKLQNELKRSNDHLKQLSYTDYLTGLFNRRYLMKAISGEINRANRSNQSFSLILLDIDFFKKINDYYGHQKGDSVLEAIAGILQARLRSYATVARYGGEEFAILLPATPLDKGMIVAERMRETIQAISFGRPMESLTITASFGIASYPSEIVRDSDSLLYQADEALYRAKHNGRNCVEA